MSNYNYNIIGEKSAVQSSNYAYLIIFKPNKTK